MSLTWSIPWWSSGSAVIIHISSKVVKRGGAQIFFLSAHTHEEAVVAVTMKGSYPINLQSGVLGDYKWFRIRGRVHCFNLGSHVKVSGHRNRGWIQSNLDWNFSSNLILLRHKDSNAYPWASTFKFCFLVSFQSRYPS